MHVATSSGLIFLFDPTANVRFKSKLVGVEDPQLTLKGRVDQQDSILSEMETRMNASSDSRRTSASRPHSPSSSASATPGRSS
ncbi:hypothetical protein EMGBS6_14610 [Opitutia bacterium]|nr:hypothetical protein EMGBS6_14610 [Opitutae bacterium]